MKKPKFGPGDVILEIKVRAAGLHKITLRKDTLELIMGPKNYIFDLDKITSITPVKGSGGGLFTARQAKPTEIRIVGQSRGGDGTPLWSISFQYNQKDEINKFVDTFYETQRSYLQRKNSKTLLLKI